MGAELSYGGEKAFESKEEFVFAKGTHNVTVPVIAHEVKQWWPNGSGAAELYDLRVTLSEGESKCFDISQKVGFKDIELKHNPESPGGSLPYTFCVNGKTLFIKGFNVTPFDQLLGCDTEERIRHNLLAVKEAGANLIRVWGGGIIESPAFYEICSEYGLMVWQDMIQSSSGLSNRPSERADFLLLLEQTCIYALKTRRNYACTTVICGGNELYGENDRPVTFDNANIAMIKFLKEKYCPELAFFPSTATGPVQDADMEDSANNHNIHGPWSFLGKEKHYSHYNRLKCLFNGEFGCNGMSSVGQLERILPKEDLAVNNMRDNIMWRYYGEWWDMYEPITDIFGEITDLNEYITLSQFLQYSALRYAVASLRRGFPYTSGCIIWQLNELWPNVCCSTILQYDGNKKPVYYAVKGAYDPVSISARYDRLVYSDGEDAEIELFVVSDGEKHCGELFYTVTSGSRALLSGNAKYSAGEGFSAKACSLKVNTGNCESVEIHAYTVVGGRRYSLNELLLVAGADGKCGKEDAIKFIGGLEA